MCQAKTRSVWPEEGGSRSLSSATSADRIPLPRCGESPRADVSAQNSRRQKGHRFCTCLLTGWSSRQLEWKKVVSFVGFLEGECRSVWLCMNQCAGLGGLARQWQPYFSLLKKNQRHPSLYSALQRQRDQRMGESQAGQLGSSLMVSGAAPNNMKTVHDKTELLNGALKSFSISLFLC